jgi:neutral ceramidase
MRRLLRILARTALVFVALILILLVAGLSGIDYQPYLRTSYFQHTSDRLQQGLQPGLLFQGPLKAGFSRVKLTPEINAPTNEPGLGRFSQVSLAGYGSRQGAAATGVHDDVWVKAVALEVQQRRVVLVASDALIVPREVAEAATAILQQELGLPRESIYFGATHTHSSLGGWGQGLVAEAFAGKFQPGVRVWFAQCLARAVREAVADLAPATLASGSFTAPEFVRNRLVGAQGRIDPEFSVLHLKRADGRNAVVGAFAAHATVLGANNLEFSADYPGEWQRAVEAATGGVAVFFGGGVGSHSPVPGDPAFAGTKRMGEALARRTTELLPNLTPQTAPEFGVFGLEVSLPELHARVTDERRLTPAVSRQLLPVTDRTYLQAVRLGQAIWVSTPCDFSGELALPLKEHFALRGYRLTVTSFNGDYIGYVVPAKYYHLDGYEPRTMSFFGPTIPDYFDELIRRMGEAMGPEPSPVQVGSRSAAPQP